MNIITSTCCVCEKKLAVEPKEDTTNWSDFYSACDKANLEIASMCEDCLGYICKEHTRKVDVDEKNPPILEGKTFNTLCPAHAEHASKVWIHSEKRGRYILRDRDDIRNSLEAFVDLHGSQGLSLTDESGALLHLAGALAKAGYKHGDKVVIVPKDLDACPRGIDTWDGKCPQGCILCRD
jgi:hypothetical protein